MMYVPVGSFCYYVYGDQVESNVFRSLTPGVLVNIATVLITIHLASAYIILQNPLSQVLEKPLKIPNRFGWQRVIVRSAITALVVFTAESCPRFGHILALVGGSAVTLNTFVFPSIFYWRFCTKYSDEWLGAKMPSYEKPLHLLIIGIGLIGGISSTYSAIREITDPNAFVPPCYINITAASNLGGGGGGH